MRGYLTKALQVAVVASLVALGGCVAYPAGPYAGGGYYAEPAPVVVAPVYGGFGYYGGHYGHYGHYGHWR